MANASDLTVVAVFDDPESARSAANDLKAAGFGSDKVYVSSDETGYTGSTAAGERTATTRHHEGGITGWFKSLFGTGGEDDQYRRGYEGAHATGKTIVGVDTPEASVDQVSDILNRYSPIDVHEEDLGTARGIATPNTDDAGFHGSRSDVLNARDELRGDARTIGSAERGQNIPVVEEGLQVGKRTVQRGGVRVHSRMTERPVEENVNLREEHVRVDRQPVDRAATEADFRNAGDRVIEVDEFAEEPVIAKQGRVVEEVRVGKDATERTETVRDTLRRTEVEVENLGRGVGATTGSRATDAAYAGTGGVNPVTAPAASATGTYGGDYDVDYRQNFATAYPAGTANYDDYAPAYRFGSDLANDPRYRGRDYSEVESDLRGEYGKRYPNSTWDKMKDSVRYGWDRVTGKARTATANR